MLSDLKSQPDRRELGFGSRNIALSILMTVEQEGGYANLITPQELRKAKLEPRDSAFVTELVYGTIRKRSLYDAIIESAADAENEAVLAEFNAKNIDALNILMTRHKVVLRRFGDEVMRALGEASGDVVADAGNGDAIARKVYDSFMKFRRNAVVWTKVTDQAYGDARLLPFRYGKT